MSHIRSQPLEVDGELRAALSEVAVALSQPPTVVDDWCTVLGTHLLRTVDSLAPVLAEDWVAMEVPVACYLELRMRYDDRWRKALRIRLGEDDAVAALAGKKSDKKKKRRNTASFGSPRSVGLPQDERRSLVARLKRGDTGSSSSSSGGGGGGMAMLASDIASTAAARQPSTGDDGSPPQSGDEAHHGLDRKRFIQSTSSSQRASVMDLNRVLEEAKADGSGLSKPSTKRSGRRLSRITLRDNSITHSVTHDSSNNEIAASPHNSGADDDHAHGGKTMRTVRVDVFGTEGMDRRLVESLLGDEDVREVAVPGIYGMAPRMVLQERGFGEVRAPKPSISLFR